MSVLFERDEAEWARREAERTRTVGECVEHSWRSTPWGGVCVACGETVNGADL